MFLIPNEIKRDQESVTRPVNGEVLITIVYAGYRLHFLIITVHLNSEGKSGIERACGYKLVYGNFFVWSMG